MTATYATESAKTSSEKITLAHIEPEQRLINFTLDSGSIYTRDLDYFCIKAFENGTLLTEASSSSLNSGEFYFDAVNKKLYVRTSDDTNPNTKTIKVTYRFFFSSAPLTLPHDLTDTGIDVEYDARLPTRGGTSVNKEIDEEQIGVALETATNLTLQNNDGYFDDIYDLLFWEFKEVRFYSWFRNIDLSEKILLFEGIVQDKDFNTDKVTFSCKDFLHKLREPVQLTRFSQSDGNVPEAFLGTPKRRLYGQFKQLNLAPIDATLEGYTLTGTISGTLAGTTITGSGTAFLDELSPKDVIKIVDGDNEQEIEVDTITSDTSFTTQDELEFSFSALSVTNSPNRPWRKENRNWHIAGHKLRAPSTTVTAINAVNRYEVASTEDFFADDLIDIIGEDIFIRRISGNEIVTNQAVQGVVSIGSAITKNPVSAVFIETKESFINRDWTVANGASDAILNFNNLAEFNVAKTRSIPGSYSFTNSSRTVTVNDVDLRDNLRPRDWIRSTDVTHTTWYEILDVTFDESVPRSTVTLRTSYAGGTASNTAQIKQPELIGDDTLITVNCIGLERSGAWVKTASDAVKDMLENDSVLTNLNTASFTESDADAPYILSLPIPLRYGQDPPTILKTITQINKSVFGSLVNNTAWELVYNVLTPERPTDLTTIKDDDLASPRIGIKSKNEIVRKVILKHRPFIDIFTNEESFDVVEFENDFVDDFIGAKAELNVQAFLFSENDAQTIAERYALYNSLSQSKVTIRTKLDLALKNLNDKIFIELDRLYKRFGNGTRRKVGIINRIKKDGNNVEVDFNDLGNVFNRVGAIAPDTANDFTSASEDEKIKNGYIVDDDLEIPDTTSDQEIFTNLIG